jgi:hypothetical protein
MLLGSGEGRWNSLGQYTGHRSLLSENKSAYYRPEQPPRMEGWAQKGIRGQGTKGLGYKHTAHLLQVAVAL